MGRNAGPIVVLATLAGLAAALLLLDGVSVPFSIGTFSLALSPTSLLVGLLGGLGEVLLAEVDWETPADLVVELLVGHRG